MTLTWLNLTNIPYFILHVKYRFPPTLPSFLPLGSESSIPTHRPGWNAVGPQNRTTPLTESEAAVASTIVPIGISKDAIGNTRGAWSDNEYAPEDSRYLIRVYKRFGDLVAGGVEVQGGGSISFGNSETIDYVYTCV